MFFFSLFLYYYQPEGSTNRLHEAAYTKSPLECAPLCAPLTPHCGGPGHWNASTDWLRCTLKLTLNARS